MTPRSFSRAAERKLNRTIRPAAAPAPIPHEPEPVPVLPAPEVDLPPVSNPEPGPPRPNTGQLLAAGENVEDFFQLTASLLDHYHPASTHESSLVEDLACERWLLLRRQRACKAIEAELLAIQPDPSLWSEPNFKRLAQIDRYRLRAERAYHRALKCVKDFREERLANYRWEAMYDMAVRQLEFEKKKHERKTSDRARKMEIAA